MDNIFHKSLRALLEYSNAHYNDNTFLSFIGGEGYTYGQFYVKACGTGSFFNTGCVRAVW